MISQTWIIGKAIRALFADRVTYHYSMKVDDQLILQRMYFVVVTSLIESAIL